MPPSSAPTHNPEYDSRFTCNVLGDNAREYVLKADRSVFDIADPFYLLVLVATAAVLVSKEEPSSPRRRVAWAGSRTV